VNLLCSKTDIQRQTLSGKYDIDKEKHTVLSHRSHRGALTMKSLIEFVTSIMYLIASLALLLISILLIGYGLWEVGYAIYQRQPYINASLDAIGLIVISMAVFDIAKYLYEEQVVRERELRSANEARQTLTKFLVIIVIAVSLEALVFIFQTGTTNIRELLYPTALLVSSVILVVGLGWYQKLSAGIENRQEQH
jgi:hypothetical protein